VTKRRLSGDNQHWSLLLQDASSAADVPLPAALREDLQMRPYQLEGYAWLAFLRRSGLHGVLADDMGLGKTLQATAIIAGDCHNLETGCLLGCPAGLRPCTAVQPETASRATSRGCVM